MNESLYHLFIFPLIEEWSQVILDDISTHHLGILELESLSDDDSEFLFFRCNDEEESIIEILLSDSILIKYLESYIEELVSLSVWDKYRYNLFCRLRLMITKEGIE
jgi:hypothetical protein